MKTFQIEDAKTRFFQSKEDYLKFKQAWKNFHNDGKVVEWKEIDISPWDSKEKIMANVKFPQLNASHYMLYNLLRGYEIHRGFVPLVNEGRLNAHGGSPWYNCDEAVSRIIRAARYLKDVNAESSWSRKWAREAVDKMLLPFGDIVSNEMLYEIAGELYTHLSGQTLPPIVVEEKREIAAPKPEEKKTMAQKIRAWRTA